MLIPHRLQQNFHFLVVEVRKQIKETLIFLVKPHQILLERINNRDNYIDTMKSHIEEQSYSFLVGSGVNRRVTALLRSINTITSNLERIGDFAVNIVNQMLYLSNQSILIRQELQPFFEETFNALANITKALFQQDLSLAFEICQTEFRIDILYKKNFSRILEQLPTNQNSSDLITKLFIFRYLEHMGDSLLNIGEALIFAIVGERLKIHQYQAIREHLRSSNINMHFSIANLLNFQSIWGTHSGCRVSKLENKNKKKSPQWIIFKEGRDTKILTEKTNLERWQELMPGLPPRIFSFQQKNRNASLLLEYLGRYTFQDLLLNSERKELDNALFLITKTLTNIWRDSMKIQPVNAHFIPQLLARINDVYQLYPHFDRPNIRIGNLKLLALEDLLRRTEKADKKLFAPFSVLIHGDFNINNIIYHRNEQRIHFIDLHRSIESDYVQDISVFLVSNFRLSVQKSSLREKNNRIILNFLNFVQGFAYKNGDETFSARLALGLIRSFFTSTRFELKTNFAKLMYLRSIYLMEKIIEYDNLPWQKFILPEDILIF